MLLQRSIFAFGRVAQLQSGRMQHAARRAIGTNGGGWAQLAQVRECVDHQFDSADRVRCSVFFLLKDSEVVRNYITDEAFAVAQKGEGLDAEACAVRECHRFLGQVQDLKDGFFLPGGEAPLLAAAIERTIGGMPVVAKGGVTLNRDDVLVELKEVRFEKDADKLMSEVVQYAHMCSYSSEPPDCYHFVRFHSSFHNLLHDETLKNGRENREILLKDHLFDLLQSYRSLIIKLTGDLHEDDVTHAMTEFIEQGWFKEGCEEEVLARAREISDEVGPISWDAPRDSVLKHVRDEASVNDKINVIAAQAACHRFPDDDEKAKAFGKAKSFHLARIYGVVEGRAKHYIERTNRDVDDESLKELVLEVMFENENGEPRIPRASFLDEMVRDVISVVRIV